MANIANYQGKLVAPPNATRHQQPPPPDRCTAASKYPDDVHPFIRNWFAQNRQQGEDLIAQLARRPRFAAGSTVPLILAFYCIVGGHEPLPQFRHELYRRVIRRLLTGGWRSNNDDQPDVNDCLRALRTWAWEGAVKETVSGIGMWIDEIETDVTTLRSLEAKAVDHVASALGPADLDTGKIVRQFIHRSLREHLVAEYVANLPIDRGGPGIATSPLV